MPSLLTRLRPVSKRLGRASAGPLLALLGLLHLAAPVSASPAIQSLQIEPAQVLLHGSNRQQQLLVTGRTPAGQSIDVTHLCELASSDQAVVSVVGAVVQGVRDGAAEVRVRLGQMSTTVPVRVRGVAGFPPVHFGNDVIPIFSKLGCNNGGCHGKASGQNGFRLSVFGFDPEADYNALVKEARGRRILPAAPRHSLLLLKPTGQAPHGGGRRIEPGSPDYRLLLAWLEQGMPFGSNDAPKLIGLRVSPVERVVGSKSAQQILATAVFSDGSLRDVTAAASYTSNASQVAEVDSRGLVRTGTAPGEAAVTVQYMGQVAAVRIGVPRSDGPEPYPRPPANNKIDELVWAKLRTLGIVPSELAGDAVFLRRLYLDVLGTLPRPDEVRAFLADRDPEKRKKWIARILERPEYADHWAMKWSDILLVNRDRLGDRGAHDLHHWLREQFARNRPYDRWVRELLTASGPARGNGPIWFYRATATTEELTRAVSQAFLGIRLECAQCHHHPFEKWGQDDFYGLAGFFNGLVRQWRMGDGLVRHTGSVEMRLPLTNRLVSTRPPDGSALPADFDGDPRQHLADWMTRSDNPWFARLAVNRLWKHYLGRGLVEPEDDLRSTNPATNDPLLDHLARTLVAERYDLKAVTRLILESRVYQLSSGTNATSVEDEQHFSHHRVKRLPAEVLLDAISAVTEVPEEFAGRPHGTRAIELWDNRLPSYFLDVFGRSERLSPCECGRSGEPTMAQCLHLINAPEVERKIASSSGRAARLVEEQRTRDEIVEELCLAALGRPAGEREKRVAEKLFRDTPVRQAAQDFLWALLNSYDFLFVQ